MADEGMVCRLATRLERTPPLVVFAATMMAGVALLFSSYAVGLNEVNCPDGLKLGYAFQFNWIWNFAFAVPCASAAVFLVVNSIRQAIPSVVASKMLVQKDGSIVTEAEATESWRKLFVTAVRWTLVASVPGFIGSYAQWYGVAVRHSGRCEWLNPPVPSFTKAALGFAAFTLQGFAVSTFFLFFFVIIAFSVWVYRFTSDGEPVELLPDTQSDDTRRGFQAFEPFVVNMLYAGLAYFGVFFLTRVHYLYVSQTAIKSPYDFAASELVMGFVAGVEAALQGRSDMFAVGSIEGMSAMACAIGLLAVVGLSILVPVAILLQAAQRSCARNIVLIDNADPRVVGRAGPSLERQRSQLKKMQMWPLQYPKPFMLVFFAITAAGTFFFYRLTFVLAAVLLTTAFRNVFRVLRDAEKQVADRTTSETRVAGTPVTPLVSMPQVADPGANQQARPTLPANVKPPLLAPGPRN